MMRLLGVLVGSALAVAALVVFVGIPEFTTESSVAESTVITLPRRARPAPPQPAPADVPEQAATAAPAADERPPLEAAPAEAATSATEPAPAPIIAEEPPPRPAAEQQWYAFWSPFRSEIAARGFVEQLQRVTGLDYRVVRIKPGVYEVAFAYADDQEITANLSQISAATGLQLPEG